MIELGTVLRHYKREDIQHEIVEHARDREAAVKFQDQFGKRPDMLNYPRDILELAKQGATSFHFSEELWINPLQLNPDMRKHELDALRKGWDLVLDIDFEEWNATKLIAKALIQALKDHGIKSASCKFSGNKGFHIGVPFEAFPDEVNKVKIKDLFPEGARRIALYLMDYIDNRNNNYKISKAILNNKDFLKFLKDNGKKMEEFTRDICIGCSTPFKDPEKNKAEFICPSCEKKVESDSETAFMKCPKCRVFMEKFAAKSGRICHACKGKDFAKKLNLKIDTILISSRHMFRSAYSLHEKSGLASLPVNPDTVMMFDKNTAHPDNVKISPFRFLDRSKAIPNEASALIIAAFDYRPVIEESLQKKEFSAEALKEAVPEAFFPPCIHNIMRGVKDGRKRSLFILINFLSTAGWPYDRIEEFLHEWNKKNPEPLREVLIKGQLRYHKQTGSRKLPPNCSNVMYYRDFGVCTPDAFCSRIRNPANYALLKAKLQSSSKEPVKGRKLTEEEKLGRKITREKHRQFKEEIMKRKMDGKCMEEVI